MIIRCIYIIRVPIAHYSNSYAMAFLEPSLDTAVFIYGKALCKLAVITSMTTKQHFTSRIPAFEKVLSDVIIENVSPEIYCRKYLKHLLNHKRYYLQIYADVLEKIIFHSNKGSSEITLIDFGAGNGLLGIFAKFCGFKEVFVNDIDEKFVAAARNLSFQLNLKVDGFIAGDVEAVKVFFKNKAPDAIAGTDVIEHIYSLDIFFNALHDINPAIVSVFTTASNPKNYFKSRQIKRLQVKDEYEGGKPGDFELFGDESLQPFLKIRQLIIEKELEINNADLVLRLAKATRGMNRPDIQKAITSYKQTARFPVPSHPTNTCNPLNGSWTERILSLDEYQALYKNHGFKLILYNGFYDEHKKGLKKILNKILNLALIFAGAYFAPYIIFAGSKK